MLLPYRCYQQQPNNHTCCFNRWNIDSYVLKFWGYIFFQYAFIGLLHAELVTQSVVHTLFAHFCFPKFYKYQRTSKWNFWFYVYDNSQYRTIAYTYTWLVKQITLSCEFQCHLCCCFLFRFTEQNRTKQTYLRYSKILNWNTKVW